jgi:hypothetical protein
MDELKVLMLICMVYIQGTVSRDGGWDESIEQWEHRALCLTPRRLKIAHV